jgi:hypothetical protein
MKDAEKAGFFDADYADKNGSEKLRRIYKTKNT